MLAATAAIDKRDELRGLLRGDLPPAGPWPVLVGFVIALAMLAGFAGAMAGPVFAVQPGMGDDVLILAFVVIVIGGIGSIRGAFIAALLVGLLDTMGRALLPDLLHLALSASAARQAGAALASMLVYVAMAAILCFRPVGLFPVRRT